MLSYRIIFLLGTPFDSLTEILCHARYDHTVRMTARKALSGAFVKSFHKDEHRRFLRDRIARLLKDGWKLDVPPS